MNAICSTCKRLINNGLPTINGKTRSDLVPHPAAGIFIDVTKPGWELEFKNHHQRCHGSCMLPECVLFDDLPLLPDVNEVIERHGFDN